MHIHPIIVTGNLTRKSKPPKAKVVRIYTGSKGKRGGGGKYKETLRERKRKYTEII
jgi:hypothetical protein